MRRAGGNLALTAGLVSCLLLLVFASGMSMHRDPPFRFWGSVLYTGLILLFAVLALRTERDWAGMGLTISAALGCFLGVTGVLLGGIATAGVMALAVVGGVMAWRGAAQA